MARDLPAGAARKRAPRLVGAMSDLQERTRWEPAEAEPGIFARWLASGHFHPEPEDTAEESFSIAIPPPNVTGALHMGHALNGSVQDTLVRFHRMRGRRTRWTLGTDHAGIATQTQVERLLRSEGSSREALGRAAFVERVWRWREEYGGIIFGQFQRLGCSCDYSDERFTLDPGYARAVRKVFVALFERNLIYRDNRMVNWDPGSRTAISDLEVVDRDVTDTLYHVDYPLESGGGAITVATVRPETMLGDTAIAVHPDDARYTRLQGETAILPLIGRRLRIIADPFVKPEFGTGALKITPGHDPNDFEIGRAHGLEALTVIGEDGRMTDAAGERFAGLPVSEAREAVVGALREEGRITRTESYAHAVPHSQRSGERIEPLISLQWFMAMESLAAPALQVVRDGALRIHPDAQRRRYEDWLAGIRPWCVSRQLWWGHQIPVWYRDGHTYVGEEPPEGEGWEQDPDVLDTWFSSALWPFATLGWPEETAELRAFYPTDVLSTGSDILFLWVARMVMLGLEFTGRPPFADVYNHSIVLAPDGRRMSKSLGTGIDPLDLIDAHGADGVRFGLLAMSSTQEVRFSEEKIVQGRQLANKLFNATRLVLARLPAGVHLSEHAPEATTPEDRWIHSRLERAKVQTVAAIEAFAFHTAALGLYDFVYGDLCDWYLELAKPRLYAEDDAAVGAFALGVLAETLALAHPVIPFVTEELWSHLPGASGLLMGGPWPAPDPTRVDAEAEAAVGALIGAVQALRGWRDRVGVRAGAVLPARLDAPLDGEQVARLARLEWAGDELASAEPAAVVTVPGGSVALLPSDQLDLEATGRRIAQRRAWLQDEIARAQKKLANAGFTAKAPAGVVQAEREKLAALEGERAEL